jgi:hypothetical protein
MRDEDYPWGSSEEERERLLASLRDGSYDPTRLLAMVVPHEVTDPSFLQWWWMFNLSAITAPEADDMVMALGSVDIRGLLGSMHSPPRATSPGCCGAMSLPATRSGQATPRA